VKNLGSDIDKELHQELLSSFIKFIEYFSPVFNNAEEFKKHVSCESLIDSNELTKEKLEVVEEINELLTSLVPHFIKFAQLERKLEKFYE